MKKKSFALERLGFGVSIVVVARLIRFRFRYNSGVMLNIASAVEAERAGEGERGGLTRAEPGRVGPGQRSSI